MAYGDQFFSVAAKEKQLMDFKSMIENESVEDVLLFLALRLDYIHIDNWYVRYKFEVIAEGLLIRTFSKLVAEGKLAEDAKGKVFKGPNWEAPQFVIEKKYGFNS